MFREGALLLKVGVVMMALALVLVIGAVVASVVLRGDPGRSRTEVARKSLGTPSPGVARRYSFPQEEGGATNKYPREGETLGREVEPRPSGHAGQRNEQAREMQTAGTASEAETFDRVAGRRTPSEAAAEPVSRQTRHRSQPGEQRLPAEGNDWPEPTQAEIHEANAPRHFHLLPGAIMALTIQKIGVYNAPVFDSDGPQALAKGVAHVPETSLPWSPTPERNVYLAGHRMGFRGTWSRMLFYELDELGRGDTIVLRDRSGRAYHYRVSEIFLAEPTDSWVMGRVRGRDMVTLQTCTPIPTFQKRLIVRAERV